MKKIFKRIGIVFLSLLIIFLTVSYINHRIQLSKEDARFQSVGTQVEVNGHMMNVYTEGSGDTTLVFLSGGGTSSPVFDFKSLYSLLSDTYRIAVVEKAGYGFSEITADTPRDIDTVLSETREALRLAGIESPYVLCPHSMSGIEALYWAQQYPEEVKAIIGLDMSVPQSYESYQINLPILQLGAFVANVGITRWVPSLAESDAVKYGTLTEDEKELYKVVFYRRTATADMLREVQQIKTSAKKVAEGGIPDVPILIFSSNGEGTGWSEAEWRKYQNDFILNCSNGALIELDCSHYVHDIKYNRIDLEIRQYLGNLQ
ncbi:alpha/beta hydrolase [Rubeoparvulum massiliense]|uniref:alpha/beta hydrolase n=1 Tax=Rubeoparvulum massiliense TaxID=1631346 RepID=UPI00065E116F|nr:alpha/beta hydrolase [Rubeoparvulum massiliense]